MESADDQKLSLDTALHTTLTVLWHLTQSYFVFRERFTTTQKDKGDNHNGGPLRKA